MEDGLLRVGILGCANIARKMSRAIIMTKGLYLYAIGSRSIEKAQAFAKDNGFPVGAKAYGTYDGVLDDEAVDIVYIPLPTSLHLEWALKAIEKGKHVLLEKPPTLTVEELDKIISAAEKQGVQLMDCTMWMHHPRTAKMKSVLRNPELFGDLLEVHASFFVPMKLYDADFFTKNIRINAELDALGALGDLGWYCARAILWAFDYVVPASIMALPGATFIKGGVITSCAAAFLWADGGTAMLHCSFYANMTMSLKAFGSKGTLEVQDFVIPHKEDLAQFQIHSLGKPEPEEMSTDTHATQESLMIQKFSSVVRGVKAGTGGLDPLWPTITRKTQLVLDAIKTSIDQGYTRVELKA